MGMLEALDAAARGDGSGETNSSPRRASRSIPLGLIALILSGPSFAAGIPDAANACLKDQTETTPSSGFSVVADGGVVKHDTTGLEWQRCPLGQKWEAQRNLCAGRPRSVTWDKANKLLAAEAKDGWRLPTGEELLSIVERCHPAPSINPQVFPNTQGSLFWTSSVDTGGVGRVWSVSFFKGRYYRPGTSQNGSLRLVRGTMKEKPPP